MIYLPKNSIILDIRTYSEFCTGHLCGAINIETPLPPLSHRQVYELANRLRDQKINKGKIVAVYCKKGVRSRIATTILQNMGYQVINLGGILNTPLKDEKKCMCF